MIVFFRKLPLTLKLLLIGIVPILFLIYFSVIIYGEKSETVHLINEYIERVEQSAKIGELINELGHEKRFSYQYSMQHTGQDDMLLHRTRTDSIIALLEKSADPGIFEFPKYTFLDKLQMARNAIDTSSFPSDTIVQFYTNAIVRLNNLNSGISINTYLEPVYRDMITQKLLSEMITYLEIIRTNIYNALFTKKNSKEILTGTLGPYKIFKSYEKEFQLKASPDAVRLYDNEKKLTDYRPTIDYIDKVLTTLRFDSTYNENQWWNTSTDGVATLRKQQQDLWNSVDVSMKEISKKEVQSKNTTLLFLMIAILFVIGFIAYFINDITSLLRELKFAARKISRGATGLHLKNMPGGVIGNLAKSIKQIDKNNILLTRAANQIGKGNFYVDVKPRSEEDILGLSIKKMQKDLNEFASQKDRIQKETEELVYKRDEFFSVASHELKTPVTSIKAYIQLLLMDAKNSGDKQNEKMLERMNNQINKLTGLINDLFDTNKLQNGQLVYNKAPFELKDLINEIIEEIQPTCADKDIVFESDINPVVNGDRERIGQVLSNLLVNAAKYAPNSKKILVNLYSKDHQAICSVHDYGSGIVPEEYQKIFERFYRISGKNLNTFPGLGLGLFISKDIIEKHEGKIWVESETENGTTFYFSLPEINQ